jgi:hypothetical protein
LSSETDARVSGDASLSSVLSSETDARVSGDASLSNALNSLSIIVAGLELRL